MISSELAALVYVDWLSRLNCDFAAEKSTIQVSGIIYLVNIWLMLGGNYSLRVYSRLFDFSLDRLKW